MNYFFICVGKMWISFFLLVGFLVGMAQAQDLKVSPSGHYFSYKGKTISLLGDSGTQVVMQNKISTIVSGSMMMPLRELIPFTYGLLWPHGKNKMGVWWKGGTIMSTLA